MNSDKKYWIALYAGITVTLAIGVAGGVVVYQIKDMPLSWMLAYIIGMGVMHLVHRMSGPVCAQIESRVP